MRIAYIQYTNPGGYPPLEHSSRILADRGWRVLFLGTSAFGADQLELPPHPSIRVKKLAHCPPGLRQKLHYAWYCIWAILSVLASRGSWVYASDPLSCPAALFLSYVPGIKVIYHEHDSPTEEIVGGFLGLIMRSRRALATRARLCVLPNAIRSGYFKNQMGPKTNVATVWNCPRREEVSGPRVAVAESTIWLLYHGSITEERLPLSAIAGLRELPDRVKFRIIGYETAGSRGYLDRIRELARSLGMQHRLEFPGTLPLRSELLRYCRQSDIGLALMPNRSRDLNMQAMAGASNKAFDYLACGLALVVTDLPEWRDTFVEPGYAAVCNPEDPATLVEALRALTADPVKMRAMGERGRERIEREWNYEFQFAPVLAAIGA